MFAQLLALFAALGLPVAPPSTWVPPDPCWDGRQPKALVKDVTATNGRFHITLAVTPTGAAFLPNRDPAGWRVGYDPATQTEWVHAFTFPIDAGLARAIVDEKREITAADVTLTPRRLVGQPIVDLVPWGYVGYHFDGAAGAVSGATLETFLAMLTQPGWPNGTAQLTSTAAVRIQADDFAWDVQNAADSVDYRDQPVRAFTFFVTSAEPAPSAPAYVDLLKASLVLHHCSIAPEDR